MIFDLDTVFSSLSVDRMGNLFLFDVKTVSCYDTIDCCHETITAPFEAKLCSPAKLHLCLA
jgi:hypothetical protein